MNNKDEPKAYSSRERVRMLNRIFQAGVDKSNQMEIDEPKLYWTPIPEPELDVHDSVSIWMPAGVSLATQRALMLQASTKDLTSLTVPSMIQGKIARLIMEGQADGLPVASLLEQLPGVSEMMLLDLEEGRQGAVNLSAQIAEMDVMEILINQVDYSKKAPLNPQASKIMQDQDLMTWVEDVLTALEDI